MAGAAEQGAIGQGLRGVSQNPVVPIHSHEKNCQLCNEGGYCLDFEDKSSCEINKSVVEKKDTTTKWKSCSCHHKKTKGSSEPDKAACCWVSGVPASKICGSESKVHKTLIINNPGKLIECGPL